MPSGKPFQVHTTVKFPSQKGSDDFHVASTKYTHKAYKDMFVQLVQRITELLQSDHDVLLKDFQISFNFIEIPHGSSAIVSHGRTAEHPQQEIR